MGNCNENKGLTTSISAFNEDDDYNYFIETTQNMPFPSKQSNLPKQNKKYNLIDFSNEFNKSNKNQNYIV